VPEQLVPEQLVQVPARQEPVRLASSVLPGRAPVCWRPAARQAVLRVRHFFRKHSRRQWPG
jgi:hypothetical protein